MSLAVEWFTMPTDPPAEGAPRGAAPDGAGHGGDPRVAFPDLLDRELDAETRAAFEALRAALAAALPPTTRGAAGEAEARASGSEARASGTEARPLDAGHGDGARPEAGTRVAAATAEVAAFAPDPRGPIAAREAGDAGRGAAATPPETSGEAGLPPALARALEPAAADRTAPAPAGPPADARAPEAARAGLETAFAREALAGAERAPRDEAAASGPRTGATPPVSPPPAGVPLAPTGPHASAPAPRTEASELAASRVSADEAGASAPAALATSLVARAARPAQAEATNDAEAADGSAPALRPRATAGDAPVPPAIRDAVRSAPSGEPLPDATADRAPAAPAPIVASPDGGEAGIASGSSDVASTASTRAPVVHAPPPATPVEAAAAARELPAGPATLEDLPGRIEWLAQRGGGAARIELDPPQLGRVDLVVRMRGSDVEVVIAAHEPAAQAAVQAQRAQLADGLAARDLRLSQLDVTGAGGEAPGRDAGSGGRAADPGGDERGRPGNAPLPNTTRAERFSATAPRPPADAGRSRIDLHA